MYYNVKAFIDTKLVKTCFKKCLVGLHEAKGDPLEKEKKSNTDDCALLPRKDLFSGWLRKRNRKFLPPCVLWKITQMEMDSMLF